MRPANFACSPAALERPTCESSCEICHEERMALQMQQNHSGEGISQHQRCCPLHCKKKPIVSKIQSSQCF